MKFFCVSGYHNVGKTTFILEFLKFLKKKNKTFGVIKSTHHENVFSFDPNKDTSKFYALGADTALVTPNEIFIQKRKNIVKTYSQTEKVKYIIFKHFFSYDWVILEGFKHTELPKIEIIKDISDINFNIVNRLCFVINEKLLHPEQKEGILQKINQYFPNTKVFSFKNIEDIEEIYKFLNDKLENYRLKVFIDKREVSLKPFVENLFYKLLVSFLDSLKNTDGKNVEIFLDKDGKDDFTK